MENTIEKVFIVAGHGKKERSEIHDPGAIAVDGTHEREINVAVAKKIKDTNYIEKIGVDEDLDLRAKTAIINENCDKNNLTYQNSILVSVHADYIGASSGVMAYYYGGSEDSKKLAKEVIKHVARNIELPVKYVKADTLSQHGRLGIVRDTSPLAILIEIGSLGADIDKLKNEEMQQKIADGILSGIYKYCLDNEMEIKGKEISNTEIINSVSSSITSNSKMWVAMEALKTAIDGIQEGLHSQNIYLRDLLDISEDEANKEVVDSSIDKIV